MNPTRINTFPKIDRPSAVMAAVTIAVLGGVVWMRFRPPPRPDPPGVGSKLPPLRLIDPVTAEPVVLLGLRGKVVWVTFWSAASPTARNDLAGLEKVWRRFRRTGRFAMAVAAVESGRPELVRAALAASRATFPAYLAAPETTQTFGADRPGLPLHVLVDDGGRVMAVARGGGPTLDRLSDLVEPRLEELEPLGNTRFAVVDLLPLNR